MGRQSARLAEERATGNTAGAFISDLQAPGPAKAPATAVCAQPPTVAKSAFL